MNARRDVPANERRLTDADFEPSARVFVWPCDKRKAHGPHPIMACSRCYGRAFSSHPAPCDKDEQVGECPGVKAHPKTMIGGRLL